MIVKNTISNLTQCVLCIIFILTSDPAHACLGPSFEYRTFNASFAAFMKSRDVVAKVKILSYKDTQNHNPRWENYTKGLSSVRHRRWRSDSGVNVEVQVLEAVKNIKKDQKLTVFVEPYGGCNREPYPPIIGTEAFIAGTIKNGIFEGVVKNEDY